MAELDPAPERPHHRRPRYSGRNPRRFEDKYKELDPEKYPDTVARVLASGKTPAGSHRPILVQEILEVLAPAPGSIMVDATLGYGGHALELLAHIQPGGRLIGIDTDPLQLPRTIERIRAAGYGEGAFIAVHSNYAGLPKILAQLDIPAVDAILADLGVSSMQLDDPARGFTHKASGPLDLRMNPQKGSPASALLARASTIQIAAWLVDNSDEPRAQQLASSIVQQRERKPILTTTDLREVIETTLAQDRAKLEKREIVQTITRVFQALRIVANDEFSALEMFLRFLPTTLKSGGRVAILTFHSGEDRRVKRAFADGLREGAYASISREVIRATPAEVTANPRASSAKLRWAIKS